MMIDSASLFFLLFLLLRMDVVDAIAISNFAVALLPCQLLVLRVLLLLVLLLLLLLLLLVLVLLLLLL